MNLKEPIKLGFGGKKGKAATKNLPVKRSINLAGVGEKPIKITVAAPAIVLIVLAAILISKFAVVDRLIAVSKAQAEVASLQSQLDASYAKLEEFGELKDEYAHYTYSGMTKEELERTDRVSVLSLIQRVVIPQAAVSSWTVTENILTLNISRSDLQEINLLAQQLWAEPLVDYVTVTTAATNNEKNRNQDVPVQEEVNGQILVYLKSAEEEEVTGNEAAEP